MTTTEDVGEAPPLPGRARRRRQRALDSWHKVQSAWRAAGRHVPAIRADLAWYAGIHVDRARLRFARLRTRLVFGLSGLLAVAILFAIASWLLVAGVAGGVGELLGDSVWLGQAVTGGITLLLLGAALGLRAWWRERGRLQDLMRRHARLESRGAGRSGDGGRA